VTIAVPRRASQSDTPALATAGDGLLNAPAMLAIALLVFNDHVLKEVWPGLVSGKLSDFVGLLFFPLLIQAVVEVGWAAVGRWRRPSHKLLVSAIGLTAIAFAAIKTLPAANALVADLLGRAQWLISVGILGSTGRPGPVSIALDVTDLVALPILAGTYLLGARRQGAGPNG